MNSTPIIAIIGLGYVGLPLACLFATKYNVIGYDVNAQRINELQQGVDHTLEVSPAVLTTVSKQKKDIISTKNGLWFTTNSTDLQQATVFIITVPTPVDKNNTPDLTPLKNASKTIASVLKKDDVVIYESTVYPGVTEEECVPILEKYSNLKFNTDFFAGYSPERVNPGDKERTIDKITKVTSGSTPQVANFVNELYASVITAGTHKASSIKVAEAAKVIENAQRDINIAFVNELAKIFALMDIDTTEVLQAAGTKWNFMPFKPGLVGGHCIGVDPFYLAQKAQQMGYYSELILSARRLNDSMGAFVASQVVKLMINNDLKIKNANVLILGITFKENCPDLRNSKVTDVIDGLTDFGCKVTVFDPWVSPNSIKTHTNFTLIDQPEVEAYDAVVLAVAHQQFLQLNLQKFLKPKGVIYDVKSVLNQPVNGRL